MRTLTVVLIFFSTIACIAQPRWFRQKPSSESGQFDYFSGEGTTRKDAFFDALQALASGRGYSDAEFTIEKKTKIYDEIGRESETTIGSSVTVAKKRLFLFTVDAQIKNGLFYVLLGSPKPNYGEIYGGFVSKKNFVWRSAIAPGWGQFYNKESSKGLLFSVGEIGLIGATILSFSQAKNQEDKAELAFLQGNLAQFNKFDQSRNNWETTGTILGISAVAVWVLNVIDAGASKKNLYVQNEQPKKRIHLLAQGTRMGLKYSF